VIVYGIDQDAFATIDTVRRLRTGGDTMALDGTQRYRSQIASALSWLLRWERGVLETYKSPVNRIENSDVQEAHRVHPGIERAVAEAMKARLIANASITGMAYYVMSNKNSEIADLFIKTLVDPSGTSVNHPFFRLRSYFLTDKQKQKDPLMSLALIIKSANLVKQGREVSVLQWRSQGIAPEPYPTLDI
jgi:hypothetical protein